MRNLFIFLALLFPVVLLACGGGSASFAGNQVDDSSDTITSVSKASSAAQEASFDIRDGGSRLPTSALETVQRKVISSAFVAIEIDGVPEATAQVRVIAESLGGFVEQLSSSGEPQNQRATMTVRVPQDQFFQTLEQIEALGTVQSRNIGSEDVSEPIHRPGSAS